MNNFTETAVGSTGYVAAQGYAPPKGNTVNTSVYRSVDSCGYRLPCGLCLMLEKPCRMQRVTHNEVTCSNTKEE